MVTTLPLDKVKFDSKVPELQTLTRDWADRECTTFDEAVRPAGLPIAAGGSIWDMPAIDSKRAVSLLVELEFLLNCKLPSKLIKRGGYKSPDELLGDLVPKIRQLCSETAAQNAVAADDELATSAPTLSR